MYQISRNLVLHHQVAKVTALNEIVMRRVLLSRALEQHTQKIRFDGCAICFKDIVEFFFGKWDLIILTLWYQGREANTHDPGAPGHKPTGGMTEKKSSKPRIPAFDSVRFFLISYIAIGHFISMATKRKFVLKLLTQVRLGTHICLSFSSSSFFPLMRFWINWSLFRPFSFCTDKCSCGSIFRTVWLCCCIHWYWNQFTRRVSTPQPTS